MFEKREILRAIGEIAYVIARAGDGVQSEERERFHAILHKYLDFDSWSAISRFEMLEEKHPDPEKAFEYALAELKKYKSHMTSELTALTLGTATEVANAYHGQNPQELSYIQRLKEVLDV